MMDVLGVDGVVVEDVVVNSPADTAGIKPGDVITHMDSRSLRSVRDMLRELGRAPSRGNRSGGSGEERYGLQGGSYIRQARRSDVRPEIPGTNSRMIMKYLWAAFAAASACAQEIASPLPPDQMIAPEDKIVLDSQAKEIFREWDKVAVPVGQSVVALVAGNTQVAWERWWGKGKCLPS